MTLSSDEAMQTATEASQNISFLQTVERCAEIFHTVDDESSHGWQAYLAVRIVGSEMYTGRLPVIIDTMEAKSFPSVRVGAQ